MFLSLLVLGFMVWVCVIVFHGLSVAISDSTKFEYNHNLLRGYEYKTVRNLRILQVALIEYAQKHKGLLPPMQNSSTTLNALRPYLDDKARWCFRNPATEIPFTPNSALSNRKMGAISRGGRVILFYDAQPPAGYRESYYITIKGQVAHVPVADLPKLLSSRSGDN